MPPAARLYRALLRLLPRRLRDEAEADLLETFSAAHARVARLGLAARARFWAALCGDLLLTAAAERLRPPVAFERHSRRSQTMIITDLRLALRRQARTPGLSLLAAMTLGVGLAAPLVASVLARDILLEPLPFPDAGRLVRLLERSEAGRVMWPSYPNAADWRADAGEAFDGIGIADVPKEGPIGSGGRVWRVPVSRAGRGFFETLGVRPIAGRLFAPDETVQGGPAAALISERLWRAELGASALDTLTLDIGAERYAVAGVLPASFRFLGDGGVWAEGADVWTPLDRDANLGQRTSHGYHVVGRLREGVSIDQARSAMDRLSVSLKAEHGAPTDADSVILTPLHDVVVRGAREPLTLLLYAAAAVLLVSCLNLSAAILAQGLHRGRELAVRLAVGASRARLVRQLVIEASALALPGAAIGVALAAAALRVIKTSPEGTLARLEETSLDLEAFGMAAMSAVAAACLAGLIPALVISRRALAGRLRSHGASSAQPSQRGLWTGFVTAQIAITVLMLAGSGLLLRSFAAALAVDVGYDATNVLAIDVALAESRYAEPARRAAYYDTALDALRAVPGVRAAGLTSVLPHEPSAYVSSTWLDDAEDGPRPYAGYRLVDPGYFEAIGIATVRGDMQEFRRGAAFVDAGLAGRLWEDGPRFGDRIANGFAKTALPVQGVVGTVREWHEGDDTWGAVYADFHQHLERTQSMHFVVRHDGRAAAATEAVRRALAAVDPLTPVTVERLEARTAQSLGGRRLLLLLAVGFGAIALALAAAGVYAMVAFAVERQRREAAIRLALGAAPRAIGARVLGQGFAPAAGGIVLGLLMTMPLQRLIASHLFNVAPSDPAALGAAATAVIAAAGVAAIGPARRASRVDPVEALRQD